MATTKIATTRPSPAQQLAFYSSRAGGHPPMHVPAPGESLSGIPSSTEDVAEPCAINVDEPETLEDRPNSHGRYRTWSRRLACARACGVALLVAATVVIGGVCGRGLCAKTTSPSTPPDLREVWVTGTVTDANSSAPLVGVNISGSRGAVASDGRGAYATYAPVVGGRVVVSAAAFGNYSGQIGAAVYHAGVEAYAIPLLLNEFSIHAAFRPAAGLPKFTIHDVYSRAVHVTVPPSSVTVARALPPSVTLSIAVVPPSSAPGIMESTLPGVTTNSTTLQVRLTIT